MRNGQETGHTADARVKDRSSVGWPMRLLLICFLLFSLPEARAQQSTPATPSAAKPANGNLTRASFSASGLKNEKLLTDLYAGNFVDISLERQDVLFQVLYSQYLEAFGRHCDAALPPNKVEITRQVCAREQYPVNRYGAQVGPSSCVEYRTEGTGLYADPVLYETKAKLEQAVGLDTIRQVFRTMNQKNPLGAAMDTVNASKAMANDMNALVQRNACAGPGLKRFQENLMLFAMGKQPIRLDGGGTPAAASRPSPAAPFKDSNYTKLLEDLILEQSKTWVVNRYVSGSVSNVVVSSRDAAGRPAKLVGRYLFNGRSQGSVTVSFTDGLPECMYFFDSPSTCRTPNRRVVASYANGSYQQ